MSEEKKSLLGDLTQDLGIGATAMAVITALWAGGWWQWIPAVLVVCLGVYTLGLKKVLPWQITLHKDLEQLNDGKGSHPRLAKTLRSTLDDMLASELQHMAGGKTALDANSSPGRWHRSMLHAEQRLDGWMGSTIWSWVSFKRLLLVALAYPYLIFLLIWLWNSVAKLGAIDVFPTLGKNTESWFQRSMFVVVFLWPLGTWLAITQFLPRVRVKTVGFWVFFGIGCFPVYALPEVLNALGVQKGVGGASIAGSLIVAVAIVGLIATERTFLLAAESLAVVSVITAAGSAFAGLSAAIPIIAATSFACVMLTGWVNSFTESQPSSDRVSNVELALVGGLAFGLLVLLLLGTAAPREMPWLVLTQGKTAFLFTLGWIPLINACFDWLSLGITRELLRRMTRSPGWMWGGVLLDLFAGVALTLGLLWLAFQVLAFMQWCGWPVDAQAMRDAFIAEPFDPQVSWLAMLAVTNLLPTIWHLGVSLWGLVDRQFTTSGSLKNSLQKLIDFMDEHGNPKPGAPAPGLGALELQTVYHSLFVHPWLYVGTVFAVVVGFWGSYLEALRWTLTWLP